MRREGDADGGSGGGSVELRLIFPCAPMAVRRTLRTVRSGLGTMSISEEDGAKIELVLAEVLNNIAEHAYSDHPDGEIELRLSQSARGLFCRVIDRGAPMPGMRPPPRRPPDPDGPLCDQPEGGFGWFLIHELARDLTYLRDRERNVLTFWIDIGPSLRRM